MTCWREITCATAATASQPNITTRVYNQRWNSAPGTQTVAKILIVDDDPAVRATIRLLLERAGHSVVVEIGRAHV